MTTPWNETAFTVAMQHLAPGDKLSEVEFLKRLGTCQWDAIARVLGRPTQEITSEFHERLYASWIDIELKFGSGEAPDRFGEGARIRVRNRVRVFAKRFIEGFFVFGADEVPDALLQATKTRDPSRPAIPDRPDRRRGAAVQVASGARAHLLTTAGARRPRG